MQKLYTTLFLIVGVILFSNSPVKAISDTNVPFFAGDSSSVVDTTTGNLAIFNASRGFFPLPLSASSIPSGMPPTDNPVIALPDTIILSDTSNEVRGLVIYRVLDGALFVNTFVGKGNESAHSASYFGEGDFVMVMTAGPDDCVELTLSACRSSQYFLKEAPFLIQ